MARHRHNPLLANRANQLRRNQTDTEREMWRLLRSRTLAGYKFRRQYIIGSYIVDFCCVEQKLIVELDGGQHQDQKEYDDRRTRLLQAEGFKVLRFWDNELLKEPEAIKIRILESMEPQYTIGAEDGRLES